MNLDQVYLDTLHEYLYCHRMLSEYSRYCYRVYRKIVRSHPHDHRAWDGLGQCCQYGYGTAPNLRRAKKYYKKAAKLGDADAQNAIGFLYDTGRGVRQSYKRALKWYARAATGSFHDEACNNIGNLYHNGLGVKRDVKRAKHWYKLAVRLGNEMAERNLALLQNEVKAAFGR